MFFRPYISTDMEKYIYEPLNLNRRAIRLLHLHPGDNNSEISCSLSQAELNQRNDTISYEALSYTWGFPDLFERIIVDGCYLNVTYNLHSVLQQLRYADLDRILWIDAICIDQGNKKERGHQVEQMSKIYKEADRVIFWLGPGTIETDMVMESLQLLQRESLNYNFGGWSSQDDRWKKLWTSLEPAFERSHKQFRTLQCQGLRELLARPWFRRIWILQEVALAKAGILICGRKSVSARLFGLIPLLLGVQPDAHCQSVLDIMPSPWRKTSWWSKSSALLTLLLNFGDSEATEPRDLVYALRGMSSDASGKNGIIPDYDISEKDVVREVVQFVEHCDPGPLVSMASEKPPRTIRDLIKFLRARDLDRCKALAIYSLPQDMEMLLERSNIRVNQNIITTAVVCDKTGEVVEILLRYRHKEFIVNNEVLVAAAANESGAKGIFEALLRYQGDQFTIPGNALRAAAENKGCGGAIFEVLCRCQGDKIIIRDDILQTAAQNEGCGGAIFEALCRYKRNLTTISNEVLKAAARNEGCGGAIFEALCRCQGDQITILGATLKAAARNRSCGGAIFEALCRYQGVQITFSDIALGAAARNRSCGDAIFEALRRYQGGPIEISDGVIANAEGNEECGVQVLTIILDSKYPLLLDCMSRERCQRYLKWKGNQRPLSSQ